MSSEELKKEEKMVHYVTRTRDKVTEHHCFAIPSDVVLPFVKELEERLQTIRKRLEQLKSKATEYQKWNIAFPTPLELIKELEGLASDKQNESSKELKP